MRFSYKTKVIFIIITGIYFLYIKKGYTPSNPNKINQDSYITSPNINSKTW